MRAIINWLTVYSAWLCRIFSVTPDSLRNGRRGNQPPPTGGFSA